MTRPASPSERARAMLIDQRAGLEAATSYWTGQDGAYARQRLSAAKGLLAKVASHEADMARAPDFFAPLVLGFMGQNGWGPLIRMVSDVPAIRADLRKAVA